MMAREGKVLPPGIYYGWVIVAASLTIQTVVYGAMYSFGVFFNPISEEFHWSYATTSLVASIGAVEVGLLGIVAGVLSDKYGPRIVVFSAGLLLGLSHLLTGGITALWQFYLFYGLLRGLGMSGTYTPLLSTIPRWFEKKRGLALGIVVAGIGLGTMLLVPISAFLITAYHWRTAFVIVAVVIWLTVLPTSLLLRRRPEEMGLSPYGKNATSDNRQQNGESALADRAFTVGQAVRTRKLWVLFSIFALNVFALGMVMVHMVPYARGLKISDTTAATFLSIIGGTSILGRIVMGGVGDRTGINRAMAISLSLMAVPMFFITATRSVMLLYGLMAIFGFGYGGMVPQVPAATGHLFGMKSLGTIFGVVTLGATVGNALGPFLAGYIHDATGSYRLAFTLGVVALVLGAVLAFFLMPARSQGGYKKPALP